MQWKFETGEDNDVWERTWNNIDLFLEFIKNNNQNMIIYELEKR
jgi:hypothetical protein